MSIKNMNRTLEKVWVTIVDSSQFRKFARAKVGDKLLNSKVFEWVLKSKNNISTSIAQLRQPNLFKSVQVFVFFIGHNKSGTSMIGALLDAHPNAIVSDEVGAVHYLNRGFSRDQVFHLLLRGSRREYLKGRVTARRLTPYSYLVPGQWQGRYKELKVIGDGRAGSTTRLFSKDPDLYSKLSESIQGPSIKMIQVIRNPFDVISVMMVRGNRSFDNSISNYFNYCETLRKVRSRVAPNSIYEMKYEKFVNSPSSQLTSLCDFLGLESIKDYLSDCQSIIHQDPVQHRQMVDWTPELITIVEEKIKGYDFLEGYSFD
jgi:hypothetical protein